MRFQLFHSYHTLQMHIKHSKEEFVNTQSSTLPLSATKYKKNDYHISLVTKTKTKSNVKLEQNVWNSISE